MALDKGSGAWEGEGWRGAGGGGWRETREGGAGWRGAGGGRGEREENRYVTRGNKGDGGEGAGVARRSCWGDVGVRLTGTMGVRVKVRVELAGTVRVRVMWGELERVWRGEGELERVWRGEGELERCG